MILIIGGRYGSIDDETGKSITNLEYLAAREKGIPIYAFVEKSILSTIEIWKTNPSGDFSDVVDTAMLFEFVDNVRSGEKRWVFPFEEADDIIEALRSQFGYLFREALELQSRLGGTALPSFMTALSPRALRIALEEPEEWEYRLLFQCMADGVASRSNILREYNANLTFGVAEFVPAEEAVGWMQTRLHEIETLVDSATKLFNNCIDEAIGKPGVPANAEYLAWVALTIAKTYESALMWARHIRCARIEPPFDRLAPEMALLVDDLIRQFNEYPKNSLAKIDEALETSSIEHPQQINLTFTLDIANLDRLYEVMHEVETEFLSG